jgi:murein hydrolase activator
MRLYSLLFLVILITVLSLSISKEVYPADDSLDNKQNQINQIETDLSHEKAQYLQFDQKEKSLLDQLSDIEKGINEKKIILKNLGVNVQVAQDDLKKQRAALQKTEKSFNKMKNLLDRRLAAFYKYAKRGYLRIFADTKDLTQLNHMIKYLTVILDKDRSIMKQASKEHEDYKQQISLVEKNLKTISDMKEEESLNLSSLKTDLDNKVILLSRIHREKEFYGTAVKELGSAAENLKDTIKNLDNKDSKTTILPSGFAELKGKLPLPIDGKIVKDNKKSKENIFKSLKGIYITASFGTDVKSIFKGRVDYSGQLKGYGQVVIINHGSRFYTLSAYLSHREKAEGDMVEKGDVIGQVGETGLMTGSALYFEIRNGESNLDTLKWLKVH